MNLNIVYHHHQNYIVATQLVRSPDVSRQAKIKRKRMPAIQRTYRGIIRKLVYIYNTKS